MRRFTFGALFSSLAAAALVTLAHGALAASQAQPKKTEAKTSAHKTAHKGKAARAQSSENKSSRAVKQAPLKARKSGYQKVAYAAAVSGVPPLLSAGDLAGLHMTRDPLALASNAAFVVDQSTGEVLLEKNAGVSLPIASITKLMTSLVVVEAGRGRCRSREVQPFAPARRFPAHAGQHAAHCTDELGEPRRFRAGAQLPRRPECFRVGHERQGQRAGHDQVPFLGFDRTHEQ